MRLNRRTALGLGTVATAGTVLGAAAPASAAEATEASPTTPARAARRVAAVFSRHSAEAGGNWQAYVSVADPAGTPVVAVRGRRGPADRGVQRQQDRGGHGGARQGRPRAAHPRPAGRGDRGDRRARR